ncbi:hypothetical protein GLOIN_2v165091 [Rhizophagus irregularis DAOM 181602=DAOM 197198]|nr:hypothetical protein GLOIN_2v165091 [Rhizophagus irregularis DAOM 181602=DAOM 197198]
MSQKNNNEEFEFNYHLKRTRYINITDEEEEPEEILDNEEIRLENYQEGGNGKCNIDSGSTGNLFRHLNKLHLNKVNPSIAQQAEIIKNFKNYDQPFTVVELPEFCYVIQICNAEVQILTADTIKSDTYGPILGI